MASIDIHDIRINVSLRQRPWATPVAIGLGLVFLLAMMVTPKRWWDRMSRWYGRAVLATCFKVQATRIW